MPGVVAQVYVSLRRAVRHARRLISIAWTYNPNSKLLADNRRLFRASRVCAPLGKLSTSPHPTIDCHRSALILHHVTSSVIINCGILSSMESGVEANEAYVEKTRFRGRMPWECVGYLLKN